MIYKLRRKFIGICIIAFLTVFVVLFLAIYIVTSTQTNKRLDTLADVVSSNDGKFPQWGQFSAGRPNFPNVPDGFNTETPFTTRFFTVRFDKDEKLLSADVQSIASVTKDEAYEYALEATESSDTRGWTDNFRYKVYNTEKGEAVVFINGLDEIQSNRRFMVNASLVFAASSLVIITLVVLISKKAVKPAAESYEKQKQFITNANHELKTPLTLIRTNIDIMEAEIGENEWLTDIRTESKIMTELVNQLVTLARMDEDGTKLAKEQFSLSEAVLDTVSAFVPHIENDRKVLLVNIEDGVMYNGNEAALRRLVSILMDNAIKYCDSDGTVSITLRGGKPPFLSVDNTYGWVNVLPLDKLFDRFYRADKARTSGSGFGIGLSIAKSIVEKHKGQIKAVNIDGTAVSFQVEL